LDLLSLLGGEVQASVEASVEAGVEVLLARLVIEVVIVGMTEGSCRITVPIPRERETVGEDP